MGPESVPSAGWHGTVGLRGALRLGDTATVPSFVFFNDTATTEIYTLSLHDALPIYCRRRLSRARTGDCRRDDRVRAPSDRKSTRLNSSHRCISYAVFCLKKKTH